MCEFETKLVAWIDRELDAATARDVELHLEACHDCSARVAAYREVSTAFAAYFEQPVVTPKRSRTAITASFLGLGAATAAAITLWMFRPLPVAPPSLPKLTGPAPAIAYVKQPAAPAQVSVPRHRPISRPAMLANAASVETQPTIEIAIPADAVFAPGAFPTGFTFAADLSIRGDGSPETLRVRPATFLK
jgi:Putative zinc-finger